MMMDPPLKRQRETLPNIDDLMTHTREMWRRKDPLKAMSTQTENRDFRDFFGCGLLVALEVWRLLHANDCLLVPQGGRLEHLLWLLAFMKTYGRRKIMCTICGGVDYKTLMKWVLLFVDALALWQTSSRWL
jgi:hypothetical protein